MKQSGIIIQQAQLSADPASPSSGYSVLFPRSNGNWYRKNADGSVKQIDADVDTFGVAPRSSNYTILTSDREKMFTNEGASGQVTFTLPAASAGLRYSFFVQDADGMAIVATGATIRIGSDVSASGGSIGSDTVGAFITLVAINSSQWVATSTDYNWIMGSEEGEPLSDPASFSAVIDPDDSEVMNVTWSAVSGATTYTLQRAIASNYSDAATIYEGPATAFDDTTFDTAVQYYYRVRASAAGYLSSNWIGATPVMEASVAVYVNTTIVPTGVKVDWNLLGVAPDNFLVQRKTGAGGSYSTIQTVSGSTFTYTDTTAVAGTIYYYRVQYVK